MGDRGPLRIRPRVHVPMWTLRRLVLVWHHAIRSRKGALMFFDHIPDSPGYRATMARTRRRLRRLGRFVAGCVLCLIGAGFVTACLFALNEVLSNWP